ncbi:MAG: HAMP domain-containing protein [Bryobacterales bacterium]|nr:HAMP domain-containing protein [Bryobacterales bacterium]
MRPRKLKTRLTGWYVGVMGGILALFGAGMSAVFFWELRKQLDLHAIEQIETLEGYFYFRPDGKLDLRTDYHDHPYPSTEQSRFIEVRTMEGEVVYRNDQLGNRQLDGLPMPGEGVDGYSQRSMQLPNGPPVRLISRMHPVGGKPLLIRLGISEVHLWESFLRTLAELGAVAAAALCMAAAGGYFLVQRTLRPMEAMARRAREINAEQLNARLPVSDGEDELGHLAMAFNETLGRLERSFQQLRRFTSDAAHELRTPLTAIRSVGEVGLRERGGETRYRETIESMLEEATRLGRLVEGLLAMARADAGQVKLQKTPAPLLRQAREVAALLEVLAEEKHQQLSVSGEDGVLADADPVILRQILINLTDNAIKYSPAGGKIAIRVKADGGMGVVEVTDSGPGIAAEHRERIFDRFYRVDEARARQTGGVGLGLAIAKWGAQAHGGELELTGSLEEGCTFRLSIPAAGDGRS